MQRPHNAHVCSLAFSQPLSFFSRAAAAAKSRCPKTTRVRHAARASSATPVSARRGSPAAQASSRRRQGAPPQIASVRAAQAVHSVPPVRSAASRGRHAKKAPSSQPLAARRAAKFATPAPRALSPLGPIRPCACRKVRVPRAPSKPNRARFRWHRSAPHVPRVNSAPEAPLPRKRAERALGIMTATRRPPASATRPASKANRSRPKALRRATAPVRRAHQARTAIRPIKRPAAHGWSARLGPRF